MAELWMVTSLKDFPYFGPLCLAYFISSEFEFSKFEPFLKSQIYQNSNLTDSEMVKMAIFDIRILPKLIPSKIELQINSCIVDINFTF